MRKEKREETSFMEVLFKATAENMEWGQCECEIIEYQLSEDQRICELAKNYHIVKE